MVSAFEARARQLYGPSGVETANTPSPCRPATSRA
jgi:hypothetical protein